MRDEAEDIKGGFLKAVELIKKEKNQIG